MNAQTSRNRWLWLAPVALAFALLGILLVLLPAQAQGSVRYVATTGADSGNCSDSGAPCLTIGYAIGQASAGDTIQIGAGTYTENLTVDKALTFVGEGAASTFVDGGGTDRVFTMTAEVSLADLTIQNGRTLDGGGGISTTFPLTLTSMAVMSNTAVGPAAYGGGIYAAGPTVIVSTTFTANDAESYGGAIYSKGNSLTLTNATFSGNRGSTGGAIRKDGGSLTISNGSFLGNRTTPLGGNGGALYNDTVSDVLITNAVFSGNWSNGPGGAMYNENSNPLLTNVTFSGNLSPYNPGGAIRNIGSTVQLVNGVMWGNSAGTGIPGNQVWGGTVVISHTLVQSGTSDFLGVTLTTGPGVITTNPLFAGAVAASAAPTTTGNYRLQTGSPAIDSGDNLAISLPTDLDGAPRIQGGTVNMGAYETPAQALPCAATRDAGATIYFSTDAAAVQQAVDAASAGDTVKLAGACTGVQAIGGFTQTVDVAKALTLQGGYTVTNWTTTYPITQPTTLDAAGGGRVISATAPLAVTDLTLQHGAATDYGGGIRTNSALTLTNVTVYSNTAQIGGGVYAEGASIYAASMVITGSHFLSNTAANGMGGGLMFFGHLTVAESRFDGNHAEWGRGGGIYATGPFTLTGVTFTNNSVAQSGATGGAVYAGPGPATGIIATMTNITVTGNSAFDGGGGIGLGSFGRVMILGGHFEANRCTANSCSGGALTLSDRPATIAATRFISNEAGYQGGGLYTSGAITITQGLFERNVLRQSGGMGGGMAAGGTSVTAVVSDTHFVSNTAGTGGGVRFFGPTQLIGGAFDDNTGGAVYAARSLVITPTLPYTYTGDFTLESTLSATGGLTFTTGTVAFWGSGATHYLTNAAPTTFDQLNVFAQSGVSVLDVGTSVVNVTGIFTNAGVIHRLAPTQTVALDETYVYTDGVGQPTVLLRQTGGAAMGDTFVRVSANLATNNFVCNGTPLSPQAVKRYFDINSGGNDSNVTADLTLRYHAPANPFFTEANNTTADSVVIYHCDGTRWVVLDGSYTRGVEGDYRWVKLSGYTFTSFSPFVLGDPPSTDANLADLALDAGTLTPTFDWATVAYTASVANSAASIRVTAIVSDDTAALQINSLAATSGVQSDPIPLIVGANVITTFVTAQDGVTTKTYTVTVTRAPSSNAELAGLALSSGPLTPSFDPATTGYTASVSYTPASIDVTAITSDTTATLALNGAPITSGAAEPVVLAVGENLITVTVTAQDGVTSLSYIITATRAAPATNAQLGGLELDGAVLSPAFISTTTSYTSEVTNLVTGLTITPTVNEGTATVTVNGTPAPSGAPFTVSDLAVGQTVITLVVTAEDGVTQQSYTITVTRLGADGDWYVDPMGNNANNCHTPGVGYACQTILGAMNKSLSGDRIFIAAATYTESLVVTKSLQFIGVGGPLVSGGGTNRVFSVTAGVDVTMDGLTVTRGWLSGSTAADGAGAGIYNSGNLTLTTTVITNNVASSAFVNTGGGGIYNAASGVLRLFGSSVISNAGYQGGGLHVAGGTVMLDHSSVFSNVVTNAMAAGGGLYIAGAATAVTVTNNSTIAGNRAAGTSNTGGGVHVAAGVLNVIISTVTNNVVNGLGGGFYLYPGVRANVTASTVFSNAAGTASNHNGGGIYSLGAVTLTNSTVTNNRAGGYGGGVYQFGNGLTIAGSAITSNTATYSGGGFYMAASAAAQALLTDSVVASNTANSGAGVYAVAQMTLTVAGGSVHNNTSNTDGGGLYAAGALTLTDVSVYSNQANGGRGGGIYVGGAATLAGGALYRNSSTSGGGGLYAAQALRLSNVDVLSNTTDNYGPSNIGYGGGIYAAGVATLTGGRVQNNRCIHETCAGGGVYLDYTGALVATDTQFLENRAGSGGGAGLNLSGVATLTGVQIISNTATPDGSGNGGSGAGIKASAALTLTNATVLSNTGNLDGGGLYVDAATVITGGSYQGNRCNHAQCSGGAVYVDGPLTLRNANISNNRSSLNGGGVSVYGVATVVDTTLSENTAAAGPGGGLNVAGVSNSLVMTNTQVLSNTSSASGGGVYAGDTARIAGGRFQNNACTGASCTGGGLHAVGVATIDAVRFIRNAAQTSGGALYLNRGAQQIVNTLLDSNSAPQGAGLYDNFGGTTILLTTVASPTVGAGSAIQIAAGTVAITDSIVASYTTGIAAGGTGALQGDYNLVYNAPTTLDIGPNSLTDDPRFRDPAAGNYRLLAASPAVGAGAPVSATTDIDGAPRPQGSGYDLGAHQVNLVWYVDPDGSDGNTCVFAGAANACKTITGALGKAQIGSTIYITTGVYTERLTVTVPIQFVGTGADAAAVVVDGGGAGRVFNVTASDATFSGLTIQNGADASGAGIRATGNLSMTNVAVLTNTATQDGGGIFAASALTLTNVEARANTASGNGGGIYASVAPSLTDVSLLSNQAQIGGGLYAPDASVLTGGLYRGNQATAAGGGIYAAGALTVTSASVLNNSATGSGGGVYAAGAVSVTSASLLNNTATGNGGGLYATGPVTVTATTVTGNAASENGGGLYAPAGAAVNGGIFQGNVAANAAAADEGGGGGLYTLAPATIVDTQFNGNRVSGQGGGGGAYISGTLTLTNVQFLNNTVALTSTTGGGGAYAVGDMMVAGGLFQGNACAGDGCQGGALFTSGVLTLTGARVVDNQAADAGGGVAATGDVVISDGVIQQNRSTSSTGGGAASMTGALTLTNTAVLSNTALGNGGGINALFGDATIDGGRIQGNACTDTACEGGGVYATNTLWLSGTQVIDNAADGTGGGANAWDTTVIDARFQGNQCIGAGCSCGGLAIFGTMAVTGTQFIANTADYYGGLCQSAATGGRVVNSLFARNAGRTDFDVAYFDSGEPVELLYTTVASPTIGANSAIVVSGTVNISNSIVASYTTGIAVAAGSLTSDYNLFYNAPTSAITGSNSLTGVNPLFFDMAADNYRLVSASPAIGAALDLGIDTDLDGTARPQLTSFDMGAFEYNPCGVANINDSGPGSLRDNLAACPEVVFDAGFFATPRTIQLSSPLTITTNVTVDGARYNIYTPTIQAPLAGGRVFTVAAGIDVTLNRLALTGGRLSGASEATGAGAGIFNAGALTVTNSIVSDNVAAHDTAGRGAGVYNADGGVLILAATTLFSNTAAEGGGLYVSGGAVTLDNALISTNLVTYTTSQRGGGVFVADGVLTVTNGSVITNNLAYTATLGDASYGGGINAAQVGALRLISGTIANNTANRGGGLYIDGAGALDLASVTVAGNRASLDVNSEPGNGIGGGIYATGALSLTGGVLRENVARISGGGLYASDWLTVTAVQFISNTAQSTESPSNHGGGGAYAVMTATVTGALFQGNAAGYVGGGLRAQQAATIAESNFFSNTAVNETGAAHIIGAAVITGTTFSGNRAAGYGALQVSDDAEIVNSLFRYNAATNAGGEAGGARIFGTALLTNVQFISNTAAYGGALLLNGGQAGWLTNTRFLSNTAGARGGAVQVDGPLTIDASHFEANQAWGDQGQGGAVYVGSTTVVTVTASNFLSNTATEFGGALADADGGGSDWVMRNSRFQGNTGGYAGAVAIGEDGSAEIADSDFVGNRTTNAGNGNAGAVYVFGPTVVVDSLFSGNAALKTGGALHVRGSTQITGTTFSANRAESFGAVYVQSATSPATIVDSTFVTNTSVNNGGAIYLDGPSYITATTFISNTAGGSGGAVGGVNVAIDASLFQSNTVAENGGAISVATARITDTIFVGNQALDGNGGALRTDGSAYVSGGRFERNRASLAGAVLTSDASVFTSVDFISNTATQSAGALRGSVDLEVIGSAFVSNTAGESAGAIYVGERGDIQASTFTGNRADASGGAIYVRGVTTITVSAFQSNTATLTGGAIEIDISGRAIISDTAIAYNRAGRNGGGVQAYGSVTFDGGSLHDNLCSPFCLIINGLYSQQIVTFTANTPYTYTDNLNLLGDVAVVGNYTFTAGIATFSPAPYAYGVTTHTLTGTATTAFRDLEVLQDNVLDVGSSVITATGVTTNAGVIHRLAPAQGITNGGPPRTYDDGVGKPTAVLAQSAGTDMGDTTVRVSANLTTTEFLCNGRVISPQAAQRYYVITPVNGANVTADLTLYYYNGAANSEANGLDGTDLRIYHCDGTRWKVVGEAADYATGTQGNYVWVKASDQDFVSFSPFIIGAIPLTNTNLINLQVFSSSVEIPLSPSFATATTGYTATVANEVVSVTVKPTITQTFATVEVNGVEVISGSQSSPIPLVVGANVITTVVYAQDGVTTQTYTVTITRASTARLSNLALSAGPLNPAFITTTQAYTLATVSFPVASTLVTVTADYPGDAIVVTAGLRGGTGGVCTGAASPWNCPLAVGTNVVSVTVTAANASTRVYTVTVPRAGDATLSNLALSAAPINPAFISTTLAYTTAAVSNATASTLVTPTLTYAASDVLTVTAAANGGAGAACSAAPYTCPLAVGVNVISVTATAIDGTIQVYTVTVPRASTARLDELYVRPGNKPAPLYPAFISTTQAYTMAVVGYDVVNASVVPTAALASDLVGVVVAPTGGTETICTGAAPWDCPLAVGENTISVTVTAADNSTRVYTVTLTRAGDATLSTLEVSAGPLTPAYISTTLAYTTPAVVKAVAGTLVTATSTYASDVLSVTVARSGGAASACTGAAMPWSCPLLVGVNVVSVTVTAADNTTQVYTVTVRRLPSDNPDLASLDVRNVTLTPVFDPATTSYTSSVPSYIARVVITPTTVDADATIAVSGTAVISGTQSPTYTLAVGDNVITAIGTAENGLVTKTYTITLTRAALVSPWYVQPDGDNTNPCTAFGTEYACQTIAGAMAKAVSGDTIYIAGATYTESLTVNKSLTFIGVNTPTVSGGGVQRVFTVTAGVDVTMDGLIVSNGWLSSTTAANGAGAGIYNAGHLTLTNSTVSGNTAVASYGGGIYQTGVTATLQLLDSTVFSNTAQQGGGLHIVGGAATLARALVSANLVTNSTTAAGGGVYLDGVSTVLTVTDSIVTGNSVAGTGINNNGGGLFVANGSLRLSDSTLSSNRAGGMGGGLYIGAGASHVITHSVIVSNTANQGAGLTTRASSSPLTLYDMTIYSNTAINGDGGGVYADPPLTLIGGSIYSNTSNSTGGGVYAVAALTMTNVAVTGNGAYYAGGGVYANAATIISGSRFERNRCTWGANTGAGLFTDSATALLTLVDTEFINNQVSLVGGGLYASGPVVLTGGEFRGNYAGSSPAGSGLFARKVVTITTGAPFTYSDGFDLLGDLAVSDNLTFTAGAVNFVVDPYDPATAVTHTFTGAAVTFFNGLEVVDNSLLDVGSADVQVTGIFTNAGVINRLAPTQTIAAPNTPYTFVDGVGLATAVVTQTGGGAMGDTTLRVSAHLAASGITCGGAQLPYGAIRRIFTVTPANGAGVTADLTFGYFDGALNSERNALDPASLVVYRCGAGGWESPAVTYTTGISGTYRTVTLPGYTFDGFGLFALGAPPSRNADLIDLVLNGATVTPTLTPGFGTAIFNYTTTVAADVFTVTARPTVSDTTASVRVNGEVVISGSTSSSIPLVVGSTVITTLVTAQDGVTTQTYTVTVTRPPNCMATPDDGATEFQSFDASAVQQAVDVAAPGATVKVAGVCTGVQTRGGETQTTYISQTLTIEGGYNFTDWTASYPVTQPTTLDAASGGRVLFATAPITVANLTMQNGNGDTYGGGINTNADLALRGVTLVSNTVTANLDGWGGGAVFVDGGNLRVDDSYFANNQAVAGTDPDADGGAVWVDGALTISNTHFYSNSASNDDGAIEVLTGDVQIDNSYFEGNQALDGYYGVLEAENGSVRISGSTFVGNSATYEVGAVYAFGDAAIVATTFLSNTADSDDGAVYVEGAAAISGSLFQGNQAGDDAGAIEAFGALAITDTVFVGNTALGTPDGSYAGAVYGQDAVTISGSTLQGNGSFDGYAGAMRVKGTLVITGSDFISNTATGEDGAVYAAGDVTLENARFQGNTAGDYAGALEVIGILSATDTQFINNTASNEDGAIYADNDVMLSGVLFQGNQAGGYAGALELTGALAATDTQFIGNSSSGNDGFGTGAGAVYADGGAVTLVDSLFQENQALNNRDVGALYSYDAIVTISNTDFLSNTAGGLYGAVRSAAASGSPELHISDSRFQGNVAAGNAGALGVDNLLIVRDSRFSANRSTYIAGAIYLDGAGDLQNVLFDRNSTAGAPGAALFVNSAPALQIVHTTIASPTVGTGAAIYVSAGAVTITDTIVASYTVGIENGGGTVASDYNIFYAAPTAIDVGSHSITGIDPLFVDPVAGDYHLQPGASYAADTGVDVGVTTDLDGTARPQGYGFSMGAYEAAGPILPCNATPDDGATLFATFYGDAVQQAVDVAAPGATVKVAGTCIGVQERGGYSQTAYISQTLTVAGGYTLTNWAAPYPITQPTTLDAQGGGRVINASVALTVSGLTVQNGNATGSDPACTGAGCGGGVFANSALVLSDVQVLSNTATHGGGVHGNNTVTVVGSRFAHNTATENGGGLRSVQAGMVTDTTFLSNTATQAGGALFDSGATVANSSFVENATTATGSAGGGFFNGIAALTNVTFTLNSAGSAGGGGAVFGNSATVSGGAFVSNTAAFAGGGAYFNGAATLVGTDFTGNQATVNRGGGAYFNGTATLANTTFTGNAVANDRGGGAYFKDAATVTDASFASNVALNRGGGAYFNTAAALTDTAFLSNTGVTRAGGAYIGGAATVSGGRFEGNQCLGVCLGGGLFVSDTLTITGVQFLDNRTDGLGGGLLTQSNTAISNTIFTGNFALLGGGGWSQAGGERGRVVNSLFAANSAGSGLGNALGLSSTVGSGVVEVIYTTIASPTVGAGSAVYVAAGSVTITDTIVASYTTGIENAGGVVASDYNLFYNAPTTVITGSHSIEGRDPRFVDPAGGDYRLAAGSAAIDTAVDVGITNDLEGALRPQGDGYDIGAYESPLSSNADLASLTPSQGSLTPPFAAATTQYTVTVAYSVASVTLTPTTVDPNATIAVSGAAVLSGTASGPIPLVVGENLITTTVTAQNGIKTKNYTVVVIRASLAALGGLEIYPGALTPAFISTTLAYTAQVTNGDPGVLITPTASAGDVITVTVSQNGGAPITCGGAATACPLVVGVNVISVTVTAADGTTQTYTITVTRPSQAWLLGLEINPGTLTPGFISTTLAYTAAVGHPVASTHVTVTASPGDVISITVTPGGGAEVACTGAPVACPLAVGENLIVVTVTAADNATHTYAVTVTRAPATDAALIALELSAGTLTPVFATETTAYAATVANIVDSVILTPTASEPNATITVNGAPVASATGAAPIPLAVGANPITTTVTAQDGVTRRDYIVIVTRPAVAVMAVNDAAGMVQGGALVIAPLTNDPDPVGGGLTVTSVGQPGHGTVVIDAGAQTVTYTPDPAYNGVDFFTYVARDINGSTDEGVVTVIVAAQSQTNDAPQIGIVDNQNGAILDFADHGFQVSVQAPAGSYTGTMGPKDIFYLVYTIIMTPTGDVNQAPNGLRFGNIVFDLSAFFNHDLLPGYRFPTPVTLELTYDPAMLGGLSEASLELFYWDGAAWSSEGITFLSRDTQNHTITIALAHLSELAVFGTAPTALEPAPEPGLVAPRIYLPVVTREAGAGAEQAAPVDVPLTPEDAPLVPPLESEAAPPAPAAVPAEEPGLDALETPTIPETQLPIQMLLPLITR